MYPIHVVVLAAGTSTRFGLEHNKLGTPLWGLPLIVHVLHALEHMHVSITVVVGYQREYVQNIIQKWIKQSAISFAIQEEQKGTGHAIACTKSAWSRDLILVLNGDMPLITQNIIIDLYNTHQTTKATVSFVAALPDSMQHAYGRVIQHNGHIDIVEAKDFTGDKSIRYPINAGIYLFDRMFLQLFLDTLTTHNASNEFYVTDLIGMASRQNAHVAMIEVPFDLVQGVNTPTEFARVATLSRAQVTQHWMNKGVLCIDPDAVYIDHTATIGKGTLLHPGVHVRGTTTIKEHCVIDAHVVIEDSVIDHHAIIYPHSMIRNAHISSYSKIGPGATMSDMQTESVPVSVKQSAFVADK